MQVSCGKCERTYEFDVAAIPTEGYEAQCEGCGEVFFVKPDRQVTVTCGECGQVYQFQAAAIPVEGYNAQCTQCQAVFFVSANAETPAPPAEPTETPVDLGKPKEPAPVDLGAPKAAAPVDCGTPRDPAAGPALVAAAPPDSSGPTPDAEAPPGSVPGGSSETLGPDEPARVPDFPDNDEGEASIDDLMALDAELGEPDDAPDGVSMEGDFEAIMRRKRRRLMTMAGLVAAVAAALVVLRFVLPGVWDASVGPLVGIKARIHPDAIPHKDAGLNRMLQDTEPAYEEAITSLERALEIDALYPEARALAALGHVFHGTDLKAAGESRRAQGERLISELTLLQKTPARKRPPGSDKRVEELKNLIQKLNREASKLYERGGKAHRRAEKHLKKVKGRADLPLVIAAFGIFSITDPDRIYQAKDFYSKILKLQGLKELDLAAPPDIWTPFLKGRVEAAEHRGKGDPVPFYNAALTKDERFLRARYEKLRALDQKGKTAEARAEAGKIVTALATHTKAATYLERTSAMAAAPEGATPSKGKKRKKKRR